MKKPKGKTPSLITGLSGKPIRVVAKRSRNCSRCSSIICLREKCFEIPRIGGGFSTRKTFCINCFEEILIQTKKDITKLEEEQEETLE